MTEDVFNHLLDIENSASTLVFEAQVEADKRISVAKAEANQAFKNEYEKIIADFENNFLQKKQTVKEAQENEYKKYDEKLNFLKKTEADFVEFLNNKFFGSNTNG